VQPPVVRKKGNSLILWITLPIAALLIGLGIAFWQTRGGEEPMDGDVSPNGGDSSMSGEISPGPTASGGDLPFSPSSPLFNPQIGDLMTFAGYFWYVLDIQDGRALLMSEDILLESVYHTAMTHVTWEKSAIRDYLNGSFYQAMFSEEQKARIVQTRLVNSDNPDDGTTGGNDTDDNVFLLSLEETHRYLSWHQLQAVNSDGSVVGWWLRSPGGSGDTAAIVLSDGFIASFGDAVDGVRGIRPALWLTLS
jgi:hypothetical protein